MKSVLDAYEWLRLLWRYSLPMNEGSSSYQSWFPLPHVSYEDSNAFQPLLWHEWLAYQRQNHLLRLYLQRPQWPQLIQLLGKHGPARFTLEHLQKHRLDGSNISENLKIYMILFIVNINRSGRSQRFPSRGRTKLEHIDRTIGINYLIMGLRRLSLSRISTLKMPASTFLSCNLLWSGASFSVFLDNRHTL